MCSVFPRLGGPFSPGALRWSPPPAQHPQGLPKQVPLPQPRCFQLARVEEASAQLGQGEGTRCASHGAAAQPVPEPPALCYTGCPVNQYFVRCLSSHTLI